ncbi:GNAT family N-acetyltransferase [Pararhizobium sp. BT-229]|uniref:GNAT family N-acetyltransferase n=1 Tax=Pararhizobium sp. BT-229 TaxID=2986923 RepID=UPI0021F70D8A|nr:GNAT family N-acetyltransferase [Pararhizobium sp. BT-229]MCV9961933.1 GNAT family N-acetyltransferase [Pararhizobium sp. BT-229]
MKSDKDRLKQEGHDMTLDKNRLELRRDLTPEQVDQLVDLFQQEWWTKGREKPDVERLMANAGPLFAFIDPLNGELVAFARAMTDGVYKAMIFDIIVNETWRNTGLGRLLMETVMTDPVLASVKHRELYCLEEMLPFYEKWGFTANLPGLFFMRQSS